MATTSPGPLPTADLSMAAITAGVTGVVAAELGLDPDLLSPDTDLRAVEGADSVKVLRIIARIERNHDIELEDEDVFSVTTIAEVANVVRRALA